MYKQVKDVNIMGQVTGIADCVERILDGASIPFDSGNRDYQEYLAWLAAGNTPLPAEIK
jgi:hypothetical protein